MLLYGEPDPDSHWPNTDEDDDCDHDDAGEDENEKDRGAEGSENDHGHDGGDSDDCDVDNEARMKACMYDGDEPMLKMTLVSIKMRMMEVKMKGGHEGCVRHGVQ